MYIELAYLVLLITFSISVDVQGYHVMARRKKETVLKKVLKHERKTSPKANIPGPPGKGHFSDPKIGQLGHLYQAS